MSGFGPGASLETYGTGSVAGFIFCVALYWARSRWAFLTLFTNPIGLAHGMWWPEYSNVQVVLALVIKYVAEKIGGTRIREERIIPAVVGFNAAFILPRVIAGIYVFFQYTMPTYWTRFVP